MPRTTRQPTKKPTPLTPTQLQANPTLHHEIIIRSSPHTFAAHMSGGKWTPARHLAYIGQHIAMGIANANAARDAGTGHIGYRAIVNLPPRYGKLLADDTPVITPTGWKRHGDLVVGDYVYSPDGKPTRVVAVSAPGMADYEIEFTNGARIKAHGNHDWLVRDRGMNSKKGGTDCIRDTRWLHWNAVRNRPRVLISGAKKPRCTYQLPHRKPLQLPDAEQTLHPYFLGVWLGDGQSEAAQFCFAKKDEIILEEVKKLGYHPSWQTTHKDTGVHYVGFAGVQEKLRYLGLLKNKHIPHIYKFASDDQRKELLAGLIDTDGSVCLKTGRAVFTTGNPALRDDVLEITRGMGFKPYVITVPPKISSSGIHGRNNVYVIGFQPDREFPTRLPRKKIVITGAKKSRYGFKAVVPCDPVPGRCIQVEAEDGMYLAGKELVPTHNSLLISKWLPLWFLDNWPEKKIMMCSYGSDLAIESGRSVRDEFESNPLLRTKLREDDRAAGTWKTKEGGGMKCEGIGGGITGYGYDCGVIDDVLKDAEEAYSPVVRLKCIEWFKSTFYFRKEPGAHIIVLGHRWHSDDMFGWLMKCHPDPWEVIKMPAIAKPNDILGRQPGEALWPERWPLQEVLNTRAADPVWFDAMHQQEPPNERGDRVYSHYTAAENLVNASDPPAMHKTRKDLPLGLTIDFNVNPGMHALVLQCDYKEDMIVVHGELHGVRMRTEGMMDAFGKWLDANGAPAGQQGQQAAFPWPALHIYGDRSGKSANTVTSLTDYDVIRNWCAKRGLSHLVKIYVPQKNPPVKDRVDTVNMALRDENGVVHVKVHGAACPKLETDLSTQPNDIDGQPDKSDQNLGHAGDAFGYAVYWMRPVRRIKFTPQKAVY